ncbi:hypothetical protein R2601_03053 [Salipiger bermudensis HTCC2601]|uniref:Uncharacterized protein n=1 Tax=Salipiger bermudensis (strain DSM 26914 / JCM 13377 / KCTC 12554 / HTCC2601) TaxID=314265 RepID=Q0FWN5_SALBH|nr:hypothetical protein R2601_03053 [Salipiger bermudensis HTCC2601]
MTSVEILVHATSVMCGEGSRSRIMGRRMLRNLDRSKPV